MGGWRRTARRAERQRGVKETRQRRTGTYSVESVMEDAGGVDTCRGQSTLFQAGSASSGPAQTKPGCVQGGGRGFAGIGLSNPVAFDGNAPEPHSNSAWPVHWASHVPA